MHRKSSLCSFPIPYPKNKGLLNVKGSQILSRKGETVIQSRYINEASPQQAAIHKRKIRKYNLYIPVPVGKSEQKNKIYI